MNQDEDRENKTDLDDVLASEDRRQLLAEDAKTPELKKEPTSDTDQP
jgi:hypothetical protein